MKKTKKTLSLILVVIMLLSVVPMQIFAVGPTLEKVEVANNLPISNNDVQANQWYNPEYPDKNVLSSLGSDYMYSYNLYFSNGCVINTYEGAYPHELLLCGISDYNAITFIDLDACQKAIDDGKDTVKVTVSVRLTKIGGKEEIKEFEIDHAITEGIVKNIKLIGDIPECDNDYYVLQNALEGRQFEVEYYDGKKETLTLKDGCFGVDCIYVRGETNEVIDEVTGEKKYYRSIKLEYIDWSSEVAKEEIECPFESIEIIDYKFNKKAQLESVTYKITYKDGRTVENTKTFDTPLYIADKVLIDTVDGYPIKAFLYVYETQYVFELIAGYDIWNISDGDDGEAKDVCNCICHRNGFLYLISLFLIRIWKIFKTNMICQCGNNHWYF